MRLIIIVLSMTVTLASYAQSISLADLRNLTALSNTDSMTDYLSPKGYFSSNQVFDLSVKAFGSASSWKFTTGKKEDKAVSTILRYKDTSAYQVGFRTISPYIYTQAINDMVAMGFNRIEAQASDQDVEIVFSNGTENILIRTDYRKTQPEFLLYYKRINGKLMAYHTENPKQLRANWQLKWESAGKAEHRQSRKVSDSSRKKISYPRARQAPLKRKSSRESYE